jgi:hypothetical protein
MTVSKYEGSHFKTIESTGKGIKKGFPGMLPKALRTFENLCHSQTLLL